MRPNTHPNAKQRGLTLVELVTALTILALFSGSLYGLLRQSVAAAADLETSERQLQATRHFLALCRSTLEALPAEATLEIVSSEDTETNQQELILASHPGAFALGEDPVSEEDTFLGLRPWTPPSGIRQPFEVFAVSLSRADLLPEEEDGGMRIRSTGDDFTGEPDEEGRYWLPLLSDIRSLEWRYWNEEDELWEVDWSEAPDRPALIELSLWPSSRLAPLRSVFRLPQVVAEAEAVIAPTAPAGGAPAQGPDRVGADGGRRPGGPDGQGPNRGKGEGGKGKGDGRRGDGQGGRGPGNGKGRPGNEGGKGPGGKGGPGGGDAPAAGPGNRATQPRASTTGTARAAAPRASAPTR